jgi:putative membrane protein
MDRQHRALADQLIRLSGANFDRQFMAHAVKDHEKAVALFESESKNGEDKDLKDWAGKTLPALREHLKMAKDLESKLKRGPER